MKKYWVHEAGDMLTIPAIFASRELTRKDKISLLIQLVKRKKHFLKEAMYLCVDHDEMDALFTLYCVKTRAWDWHDVRRDFEDTKPAFDKDLLELLREVV